MNEQDLNNLRAVFAIARKELSADRDQLIGLLNLEEKVLKNVSEEEASEGED